MSNTPSRSLAVVLDGTPMPDTEARAFWERFSAWMEEHRGDLAGFATSEGLASVHPGVDAGRPILRASRNAAQKPYAAVRSDETATRQGGGSTSRHAGPGKPQGSRGPKPAKRGNQGRKRGT
ncbi:hypothetical protein AKJ09_00719 [Labilithrix luteola]|uniref:Uncharacterized protein n=1 Tax=Labilithrix luteola TaxID=1391654 RepID=A0A0K1PKK3_9BACT|nr:hypothetical protein [Labilithrix luteola]AKU94055.1 hypothetical protein AKJ09_00719 [Labilithrix luteola]